MVTREYQLAGAVGAAFGGEAEWLADWGIGDDKFGVRVSLKDGAEYLAIVVADHAVWAEYGDDHGALRDYLTPLRGEDGTVRLILLGYNRSVRVTDARVTDGLEWQFTVSVPR